MYFYWEGDNSLDIESCIKVFVELGPLERGKKYVLESQVSCEESVSSHCLVPAITAHC